MSVIDEVKSRIDIVDFVGSYVNLQRAGRNFKGLCPFHGEKTPSFIVTPDRQTWHCFGACATGGDVFNFVMKREDIEFGEALRQLAERANVTLSDRRETKVDDQNQRLLQANEAAAAYFHNALLHSKAGAGARSYLTSRGLDSETIESFELAYRMQRHAPGLTDLSGETAVTRKLYGIGEKDTDNFGRQCLLARRMAEAGVRFVQFNYADNGDNPRWDQHSNLPLHAKHAKAVDKPIAGLLADLKARGLLEDTLLWWGGEFGRTVYSQGTLGDPKSGRDHHGRCFTVWMAGGGVKAGFEYGRTDDYGWNVVEGGVHIRDLNATILHLLGMDHERLVYPYQGLDQRLTGVIEPADVVREILA